MSKLSNFIKKKGTSISRNTNAPLNLRHSYTTDSTQNRNTRIDTEIEFFPILMRDYEDGRYSLDIWSRSNSFGEFEHPGITGFEFKLSPFIRFKNFDAWNVVQKTWWTSTNYTDWVSVPFDQWPAGTNPEMMEAPLNEIHEALKSSQNHTTFCVGGNSLLPFEHKCVFNGWDSIPSIDLNTCEDSTRIYDFSVIGHNGSNGKVGIVLGNTCTDGNSPVLNVPGDSIQDSYRVIRLEDIKLVYQTNNLFNQCFSTDDIKVFDNTGSQYSTEDIKGRCTSDLMEVWGVPLSTFENRERACDILGGNLCRNDDTQCVFDERFCDETIQPSICNCQSFNCRQCFGVSSPVNRICCRECCGYGQLPGNSIDDGEYTPILGCTDVRACNYWSMATDDNGTCTYPEDFGWCDCNGNVIDECGVCGGNGIEWGQNQSESIGDLQVYPNAGCCSEDDLRTVYFDNNCDGTGNPDFPFSMCAGELSSRENMNYCLQITNDACDMCFVQSSYENLSCPSGAVDCLGLCDGNSTISINPITNNPQCCTDIQKDKCGVCFGDNSLCTCNPDFIGNNVSLHKEKNISSTNGCVCGCTDELAGNFNPRANWPCGSEREDNMCFDIQRPKENACCWYWPDSLPDNLINCGDGEVALWGECYNIQNTNHLYLQYKELTGEIPPEIGQLTNLRTLALQGNQLTGEIPKEIGNLTNLDHLNLFENQFSGEIPIEICNQGDTTPGVSGNQLCPPYPGCISLDDINSQDTSNCNKKIKLDLYSK